MSIVWPWPSRYHHKSWEKIANFPWPTGQSRIPQLSETIFCCSQNPPAAAAVWGNFIPKWLLQQSERLFQLHPFVFHGKSPRIFFLPPLTTCYPDSEVEKTKSAGLVQDSVLKAWRKAHNKDQPHNVNSQLLLLSGASSVKKHRPWAILALHLNPLGSAQEGNCQVNMPRDTLFPASESRFFSSGRMNIGVGYAK